jgi:hypothetical protein
MRPPRRGTHRSGRAPYRELSADLRGGDARRVGSLDSFSVSVHSRSAQCPRRMCRCSSHRVTPPEALQVAGAPCARRAGSGYRRQLAGVSSTA